MVRPIMARHGVLPWHVSSCLNQVNAGAMSSVSGPTLGHAEMIPLQHGSKRRDDAAQFERARLTRSVHCRPAAYYTRILVTICDSQNRITGGYSVRGFHHAAILPHGHAVGPLSARPPDMPSCGRRYFSGSLSASSLASSLTSVVLLND
jgi:hypothetical protein